MMAASSSTSRTEAVAPVAGSAGSGFPLLVVTFFSSVSGSDGWAPVGTGAVSQGRRRIGGLSTGSPGPSPSDAARARGASVR